MDGSDVWTDEEKSKRNEDWHLFTVMHEVWLSHLCDVGSTLEVVAGISDLWGEFSTVPAVMDTSKLFHRVSSILFYVSEAKKNNAKSALQRVRDCSHHHFVEALVKRIRLAFKAPRYRSYPLDPELRFVEFVRLLDLDGDSEKVREEAVVATLPLLVQEYHSLRTIFSMYTEGRILGVLWVLVPCGSFPACSEAAGAGDTRQA